MATHQSNAARPLTLGEKRQRAADLRRRGMSYAEIGSVMAVTAIAARDWCRQFDKLSALRDPLRVWFELSNQAVTCLLTGKHGRRIGGDLQSRLPHLLDIAKAYTRDELALEEDASKGRVEEIEIWLISKGCSFKQPRKRPAPVAANVAASGISPGW